MTLFMRNIGQSWTHSLREQRLAFMSPGGDVEPPEPPGPDGDKEKKAETAKSPEDMAKEEVAKRVEAASAKLADINARFEAAQRKYNELKKSTEKGAPTDELRTAQQELRNIGGEQAASMREVSSAKRELDRLKPPATNGDAHMRQIEDSVSHLSDALQPKDGQPVDIGKVIGGFIELFAALSAACQGAADWTKPYNAGSTEAGKATPSGPSSPEKLKETALRDSIRKQIKEHKARDGTALAITNYKELQTHITTKLDEKQDGPAKNLKETSAKRDGLKTEVEHAKIDLAVAQQKIDAETDAGTKAILESNLDAAKTTADGTAKELAKQEGEVVKLQAEVDMLKAEKKEMDAMASELEGQKTDIATLNTALGPLRSNDALKDVIAVIDALLGAEPNADLSALKIGITNEDMNTLLKGMQEKGMSVTDGTSIGCQFDGLSTDTVLIDKPSLFSQKMGEYVAIASKPPADPAAATPGR